MNTCSYIGKSSLPVRRSWPKPANSWPSSGRNLKNFMTGASGAAANYIIDKAGIRPASVIIEGKIR
ncbi:MAG: hypothetical protein OP8BY_1873 [Candidatus Saccharicenans subterraneus]|uniref:Uncharacterized protein n=1 Tax=Candidatus Saccharicenans subterraneus TaxID=2508984 RepID=A0A3E2BNF4_9BACT|nr:MAG: hypothetical protein OP8BY_1873 [Candidatus Saccharicenans subterraneum]